MWVVRQANNTCTHSTHAPANRAFAHMPKNSMGLDYVISIGGRRAPYGMIGSTHWQLCSPSFTKHQQRNLPPHEGGLTVRERQVDGRYGIFFFCPIANKFVFWLLAFWTNLFILILYRVGTFFLFFEQRVY